MRFSGVGLRELKKQRTRESIADAAIRLAVDKGLDKVTIEEIAELAFVSPRTVSNYFSCKEEAVVAGGSQTSTAILNELAERPSDEPPLISLCVVLVKAARSMTANQLELNLQLIKLAEHHPSLRPYQIARYDALEQQVSAIVAARTHTRMDSDLYPWLVAAAAVSALKSAIRLWAASGSDTEALPELIQRAFEQIGTVSAPAAPLEVVARAS
jgi:AcrR family transcriptional regulator